ncbi:MAG: serine/threonine-protein kinase, partial [Mycobacterium sp.]
MEGTSFGRYRLLELLGRGGMGEVWRAHDTATDRIVAVKVLPAHLAQDRTFQQRFRREAHAAAQLNEPHVVPIHSYGEIDGRLYVDMRLIEGRDMQAILRDGPLNPARAVMIVEQIAQALQAAHKVGLVHRDVKPSNILVADYDFAYLIDFGIARGADQTGLTNTGSMIGTWHYMAPERFGSGGADSRSDIYALACVLHECLTGSPPFPGDSLEQQVRGHLTMPPPRPSVARRGVPATFDDVIARGMAKDTDQRYPTTLELAGAARSAATTPIPRPPAPPKPEPPTQRFAPPVPRTLTGPIAKGQEQIPTERAPGPPSEQPPTYRAPVIAGDSGQPPPSGPLPTPSEQLPEPEKPRKRRRIAVIGGVLAVVVLAVATTVVLWVGRGQKAGTQEVFLEPAAATGQNPFTPPASRPQPPAINPGSDPAGAPASGGDVRPTNGEEPGLYGGTRNLSSCDPEQMITYLGQTPDKARAWASVFDITT